MLILPENYAKDQRRFTSNSRGTKAGERIIRNVAECSKYLSAPILNIGCGDGFEVEQLCSNLGDMKATSDNIFGIEVAVDRASYAKKLGLPVVEGVAENMAKHIKEYYKYDRKFNIYCAHTLEHTFNPYVVISNMKDVALATVVIIVPIELSGKSGNLSHLNPIPNLGIIINQFGLNWKVVHASYRYNQELEGLLVLKRDPMNWPVPFKRPVKDLTIDDAGKLSD